MQLRQVIDEINNGTFVVKSNPIVEEVQVSETPETPGTPGSAASPLIPGSPLSDAVFRKEFDYNEKKIRNF